MVRDELIEVADADLVAQNKVLYKALTLPEGKESYALVAAEVASNISAREEPFDATPSDLLDLVAAADAVLDELLARFAPVGLTDIQRLDLLGSLIRKRYLSLGPK